MKNHKRNSAIKPAFFVFVQSLFCFTLFLSTFSFITFFLVHFLHLFLIFSLFSILSLFLHLRVSPSLFSPAHDFSSISFIAVVAYPLFISTNFSSLSFVLDLIFLFILLLYLFFFFIISVSFFCPKKIQKFLWSIFLHEIMSLFFEPSLLQCFISCFFSSMSRPHSLFVPCFTDYQRLLTVLFLIFFYQPSFWVSKKFSFCFWTKVSKKYHWYSFYHFKNYCFSWVSSCFAFEFVFSCMIFKNILLFFFVFTFFFEKYLGSFALILIFLVKKNHLKKSDSLNFSLVFLLTLFSLLFRIFMFTLLAVSLVILHAFPLFFSLLFFLFPYFLSLCLPLAMFIYSVSCASSVDSFFFWKFTFIYFSSFFKKRHPFSFVHPLFCKTVFVPSPLLFRPFSCLFLFFQSCSFEQGKLTFFFWRKNHLFNTSKNLFSEFLFLFFLKKKVFHRFFDFFRSSLFQKTVFWISVKIPHKIGFNNKMIVQISLSGNLFVFRKNPSLQPLQKNVFLSSPSCVFYRSKKAFLKKSHSKKLFSWRKTKLLLSPLDFCSIFILSKNYFLFFSCPLFFLRLSCYLFFLLFLFVFSGVCFSKQK